MWIRTETEHDFAAISALLLEAFADHPYSNQTEGRLVEGLRAAGALPISLVAEVAGQVIGHVGFSRVAIGANDAGWLMVAPLAVSRTLWGRGVGTALLQAGLDAARERNAPGCVLVGCPAYYGRFGFTSGKGP
ncbi:MAG: N-acetyltransferase, partial [Rhodospirillaceae bacterium]|nr:N-acetyltransferase [Rhodospirillaceae bacterium]